MKSISIFLLIAILLFGFCQKTFSQNMFLGGPERNNNYESRSIGNNIGAAWIFKSGGKIFTSPVLSDDAIIFGGSDSCLYAIFKNGGTPKWKFKAGGEIRSTPAVVNDRLYFYCYDGNFYCIQATDGQLIWKYKTRGESKRKAYNLGDLGNQYFFDQFDLLQSSPVAYDSLVCFGSGDSTIYALDNRSGKLVWSHKTDYTVHSSPAFYNKKIYCGSFDGVLYCLNALTGETIWLKRTAKPTSNHMFQGILSSPSVKDGIVYFGTKEANLYALDAETGVQKFLCNNGSVWIHTSIALSENMAIFSGYGNGEIRGVSNSDGKSKFTIKPSLSAFEGGTATPTIANGKFYVGLFGGRFYAMDANTGRKIWEVRTKGSLKNQYKTIDEYGTIDKTYFDNMLSQPIATVDSLFVEMFERGGAIYSTALIDNGFIYFGSSDSCLYALTDCSSELKIKSQNIAWLCNENKSIDSSFVIKNIGPIADSFDVRIIQTEIPVNNIKIANNLIVLEPGDSIPVSFHIGSENLITGKYYPFSVRIEPRSGMGVRTYSIKINVKINKVTGLEQSNLSVNIVYPNPCSENLIFKLNENLKRASIKVYDIQGKCVFYSKVNSQNIEWDLRDHHGKEIPEGIYTYMIISDDKKNSGKFTRINSK
jgi:eukaryotic-like serine/threonine-protein kinase